MLLFTYFSHYYTFQQFRKAFLKTFWEKKIKYWLPIFSLCASQYLTLCYTFTTFNDPEEGPFKSIVEITEIVCNTIKAKNHHFD